MRLIRSNHDARRGLTLIELMVVLALIGIMTALIIPEMRGTYEDALLRSAGRKLISVCSLAHSRAVALHQLHRLRLDPHTGRFVVERTAPEGGRNTGFIPIRDVAGGEGAIDSRIRLELRQLGGDSSGPPDSEDPSLAGDNEGSRPVGETIAFYPDGTADPGEIVLRDREGFQLALRIDPVTARVQIVERERE